MKTKAIDAALVESRRAAHRCTLKHESSSLQFSCAVAAIYFLVHLIVGVLVIEAINERFLLLNDAGLSFGMSS